MITPELLARMDELERKKRTVGLTEEELAEQKELYKIYLVAARDKVASRFSPRKKSSSRKFLHSSQRRTSQSNSCLRGAIDMITPELLARINELARKKRTVGLTEEELAEQKEFYKIYLAAIRGQVTSLLESIEIVDVEVKK